MTKASQFCFLGTNMRVLLSLGGASLLQDSLLFLDALSNLGGQGVFGAIARADFADNELAFCLLGLSSQGFWTKHPGEICTNKSKGGQAAAFSILGEIPLNPEFEDVSVWEKAGSPFPNPAPWPVPLSSIAIASNDGKHDTLFQRLDYVPQQDAVNPKVRGIGNGTLPKWVLHVPSLLLFCRPAVWSDGLWRISASSPGPSWSGHRW
jgi:hypothetical protein